MESRNWGSSFSRPPMRYSMPLRRMNEEFRMPPNFPSYSRPPSYHDDDFNNHDVRGNAYLGAPAPFHSSQSWRPRQKRKTFTSPIIKPYVKPEDKSKRGKGNSQESNSPGASKAASSEVTQQKQTETSNGNTTKYKAGENKDADVPTQPDKKFKTKEPTVPAEKPNVLTSPATQSDANRLYTCTLCKFETLDEMEIHRHFYSFLHREVLKHLYIFFPKQRVDFLHDYLLFKKKMSMPQKNSSSLQPFKDVFKGIGQEHYLHRVQATHCEACDVLIPYVQELVAEHIQSDAHEQNRKLILKNAKATSLAAAKALLVNKEVVEMLTKLHMGQDPFKAIKASQVGTEEILVAEEDDHFDFANYEDPIYDAREDQEVPIDHNEGPAEEKQPSEEKKSAEEKRAEENKRSEEKKRSDKKSPPNKPEMIEPATSSATVSSSLTVPPEIEEEEEDDEEAAEAP